MNSLEILPFERPIRAVWCAKRRPILQIALAILACAFTMTSAQAQGAPNSAFRLTKISVTGLQEFSERQIVGISGLFPGQNVTLQQISVAANRLSQYGVLQEVQYRYRTQNNEMDLEFQVIEADNLLPCIFGNFVWFSSAELAAQLSRNVPLYTGSCPATGLMLQKIQSTLDAMLKSKGVNGKVEVLPFAPAPGQPVTALIFTVSGVTLPIKDLHFPGAAAISEKTLIENSKPLLNGTYDVTEVTTFVDNTLLPLYGERGYLKARFEQPSVRLLTPDHALPSQDVALTVSVDEGVPYDWDSAAWTGNHAVSSDTLNKLLDMRAQAPANMTEFARGMKSVRDAYMKRGYVQVKISSQQELEDPARRVNYRFSIDEGPQFHMGTLEIEGLPDKVTARLVKKWKLQPGDVFDETYLNGFMKEAFADIFAEHLRPNNSRVNTHPDLETKTVNVEIDFR